MNPRSAGWGLLALTSLLYVYDFILRVSPGVLALPMMESFALNPLQWSWINGMFYYGYAIMQIPSGMLLDRYGARRTLIVGSFISTLCLALVYATQTDYLLALSRLVMGMAASFAYVGPLMIARQHIALKHFALAGGMVQVLGCFGAVLGTECVLKIFYAYGLWNTLNIILAVGVLITALFLLWIPKDSQQTSLPPLRSLYTTCLTVCRQPLSYLIGFLALALWAPAVIFLETWGMVWLEHIGHSGNTASRILVLGWIVIACSGPFFGWLSIRLRSRKRIIVLGLALNCVGSALFLAAYFFPYASYVAVILCACGSAAQCVTFAAVADIQPTERLGVAVGFNNMSIVCSGFTVLPLIGYCLHRAQPPETLHFILGFGFLCLLLISAFFLALRWLPETYPNVTESS